MSFCIKPNTCKKCGKPLTLFEGWHCLECEKAEQEIPTMYYPQVEGITPTVVKAEQEPKTGWIPVSERLPEFDVPVLVYQTYYKGNAITIGRYHSDEEQGGYKYWQWIMYDSWFSYGIEHFGIICPNSDFVEAWMPLPEPYKESEDKE